MKEAVVTLVQTYLGFALVWPVAIATISQIAARRYGPETATDLRRIAGPALALVFLAAPLLASFPFLGVILLGIWIAYSDHVLKSVAHSGEEGAGAPSLHERLRTLLGTDDGPFRK